MYCVSATYTPRAEGGINVDNEGFATDGSPSGNLGSFLPWPPSWRLSSAGHRLRSVRPCLLLWQCGFFKIEFGWLLARTPTVSAEVMAKAKAGFEKYGINFGSFKPTKQDNCNYKL